MKNLLLIFFLTTLASCSGLGDWANNWTEYAATSISTTVSQNNFTKNQQIDLDYLFKEILYSNNCNEVQRHIDNNQTVYDLEFDYKLQRDFLYDELLDFNLDTGSTYKASSYTLDGLLTSLTGQSPAKTATFAVVTSWKQNYAASDIGYVINQIKKCYPKEFF